MTGVMRVDGSATWVRTANWGTFGFYINATALAVDLLLTQFSRNGLLFRQVIAQIPPRQTVVHEYTAIDSSEFGVVDFDTGGGGGIVGWHIFFNPLLGLAYMLEIAAQRDFFEVVQ